MTRGELLEAYKAYLACLNRQDWPDLACFVDSAVVYNGSTIGLAGYRAMLQQNFVDIPDLSFAVELLVVDPPYLASRLHFHCTPKGKFLGLNINGREVSFSENVFYEFNKGRIVSVWSVLDKAAIEAQL
jgi:predicted ester cyclase